MFKIRTLIGIASVLITALSSCSAMAQSLPLRHGNSDTEAWQSNSVVYVAGLSDLKQNTPGALRIDANDVVFSKNDFHTQLPLSQITSVYIEDERVATGGTFHISLTDPSGTVLFEKTLKESKHGDGDSLSVTRDLARSVSKRLQKAKQLGAPAAL